MYIANNVVWGTYVDRAELKAFQGNLKKLDQKKNKKLQETIKKRGFDAPIYVRHDHDNHILDGHQRLLALDTLASEWRTLEDDKIPVVYIKAETEQEAKEKILEYNSRYSDIDPDWLGEFIQWLDMEFIEMPEIDTLMAAFENEDREDDLPELWAKEKIIVKEWDIFQLGPHRLMCGDSTSMIDVGVLMDKEKAHMLFTDPPYNMNYEWAVGTFWEKSVGTDKTAIANDNLSEEEFNTFLDKRISNVKEFLNWAFYITFYRLGIDVILNACNSNKLTWRNVICWYKQNYNLSNSDYKSIYEPIVYGWHWDHRFFGYTVEQDVRQFRKNWVESQSLVSNKAILIKVGKSIIQIKKTERTQWELYDLNDKSHFISIQGDTDVWEIEKTKINDLHPTMKPVALVERALRNSTVKWDIVMDLFGWSGTTLIACEKMGRICHMMEYEPVHVQTIIRRYSEYTKWTKPIICINRSLDLDALLRDGSEEAKWNIGENIGE